MQGNTFNLDAVGIANATGCPSANVELHWPGLSTACLANELIELESIVAVLATVATEVAAFAPINEFGDTAYFTKNYEGRKDLGNTHPGDGARYHGRGFIQITGRANYRFYGEQLGVPLEDNPDLALDPQIAARILGLYFKNHGISELARKGDWQAVRRKVNGGLNGWDRFNSLVGRLQQAADARGDAIGPGAIGPAVVELKQLLTGWGVIHSLPAPLSNTPLFGSATTDAVKVFQEAHGIQATGKVGDKTWQALRDASTADGPSEQPVTHKHAP